MHVALAAALAAAVALLSVALRDFWWFRRKWAPTSPWVLDFWAVFGRCRSLSTSATWGNAGVLWRFGLVRPAKSPRSCKWGSLASKVSCLNACFGLIGAGRHPCMNKRLKPADVRAISRKLVWWHGECGHVCQMAVSDRMRAKPGYCPYCSGRKRPERPIRLD